MARTRVIDLSQHIRDGDAVVLGQAAGEPSALSAALVEQRASLGHVSVFCGLVYSRVFTPEHTDHLTLRGYGAFGSLRKLAATGALEIGRYNLSDIPRLLLDGDLRADVVLLKVSPADADGFHSYGVAVDYMPEAVEVARTVVAEVNDSMPVTSGPCRLHRSRIDAVVETSLPLPELPPPPMGEVEHALAAHAVGLIEDGSTVQFGVGSAPEAVALALAGHRDLGLHTGLVTDAFLPALENGAVTNARKEIDPGVSVCTLAVGTKAIYAFVDRNPDVHFHPASYTHDAGVLSQLRRFIAINGALEVDLAGNVNAELVDGRQVGAVGGQVDFCRAATASDGGRSIIVLPSSTSGGRSRIVAEVEIVTTRAEHVGFVVTEFGVAELVDKSPAQRARALIAVAHPDAREDLERGLLPAR